MKIETHNGCITVTSKTGEHRTFQIKTVRKGDLEGKRIISLLSGPNNESDYVGFGFVKGNRVNVWKSKQTEQFCKLANMINKLDGLEENGVVTVQFEGRCLRCNRKLTEPRSISSGLGPECRKAV